MFRLDGKAALVTGAGSGIGEAIALCFAGQGAAVWAVDRDEPAAAATVAAIRAAGGKAEAACVDVSDPAAVLALAARLPALDILVNNAGITIDKMTAKMTVEDWNTVLAVNLSGSFYMAQPALEHMVERGTGRIIFVSSVIGERGNVGQANYAASKAGMIGLTKALAKEAVFILKRADRLDDDGVGITVNTVTPGFVATEMLEHVSEKVQDRILGQIPMGRFCRPEEVARVVHFLAADASAYITGQVWGVNGGLEM